MQRFLFALPMVWAVSQAQADTYPYGHMDDWGYGYGFGMMFGPVIWLIALGLVVVAVVWALRQADTGPSSGGSQGASRPASPDAIAELDLRLARGEIDIAEHAARKKAITG